MKLFDALKLIETFKKFRETYDFMGWNEPEAVERFNITRVRSFDRMGPSVEDLERVVEIYRIDFRTHMEDPDA